MLKYSIDRYKEKEYQKPPVLYLPDYRVKNEMGKLEFQMFLTNLGIKVGDVLVGRWTAMPTQFNTYKVVFIDEIHKHVKDWGTEASGPMILHVRCINTLPGRPFTVGAKAYTKLAEELIPVAWETEKC